MKINVEYEPAKKAIDRDMPLNWRRSSIPFFLHKEFVCNYKEYQSLIGKDSEDAPYCFWINKKNKHADSIESIITLYYGKSNDLDEIMRFCNLYMKAYPEWDRYQKSKLVQLF